VLDVLLLTEWVEDGGDDVCFFESVRIEVSEDRFLCFID
jgi:hypothetical protein